MGGRVGGGRRAKGNRKGECPTLQRVVPCRRAAAPPLHTLPPPAPLPPPPARPRRAAGPPASERPGPYFEIERCPRPPMTVCYALIKCDLGAEEEVADKLKEMEEVAWVDHTYGAYDLLAKVEAANIEKLKEFMTWNVQKMDKIRSTLTVNRRGP